MTYRSTGLTWCHWENSESPVTNMLQINPSRNDRTKLLQKKDSQKPMNTLTPCKNTLSNALYVILVKATALDTWRPSTPTHLLELRWNHLSTSPNIFSLAIVGTGRRMTQCVYNMVDHTSTAKGMYQGSLHCRHDSNAEGEILSHSHWLARRPYSKLEMECKWFIWKFLSSNCQEILYMWVDNNHVVQ